MAKKAQLDEIRPILNEVNDAVSTAESVIDTVEDAVDVVPEVLDATVHATAETARKGVRALQNPRTLALILTLGGATAGAALGVAGYFLLKKRLEKQMQAEFDAKLEAEIDGMRTFYERRATRKQPFSSPEEAADALVKEETLVDEAVEAFVKYEGDQPPPGIISPEDDPREGSNSRVRYDKVKPRDDHGRFVPSKNDPSEEIKQGPVVLVSETHVEEVAKNVFAHQATIDGWDQEREEASRTPERPYVISHDEYMENSYEHEQNSLTYYAGDDILADEREQHIDEVESLVGVDNLKLFGHGSRDTNIVYVRNERVETDFEVTLNQGTYAEEVLGFQHSDLPSARIRKGRRGDDG